MDDLNHNVSLDARPAATTRLRITTVAAILLGAVAAIGAARTVVAEGPPPNIVLIVADDLGYGDLGCYGQQLIETPRLDRLAAEGLRVTQFYAGAAVCLPPGHPTVRGNAAAGGQRVGLRRDDVTLAELARDAGYATAVCGKWGLGE